MELDTFATPHWLTDALQAHFGAFDVDLAAEPWSAVVPRFITKEQDLFKVKPRARHGFGNWPYSKGSLDAFVGFARESVLAGRIKAVTQLVPHYTAEGWWRHVETPEGRVLGAEWRYGHIDNVRLWNWKRLVTDLLVIDVIPIAKRISFRFPPRYAGAREGARFSSAVVRFVSPEVA